MQCLHRGQSVSYRCVHCHIPHPVPSQSQCSAVVFVVTIVLSPSCPLHHLHSYHRSSTIVTTTLTTIPSVKLRPDGAVLLLWEGMGWRHHEMCCCGNNIYIINNQKPSTRATGSSWFIQWSILVGHLLLLCVRLVHRFSWCDFGCQSGEWVNEWHDLLLPILSGTHWM